MDNRDHKVREVKSAQQGLQDRMGSQEHAVKRDPLDQQDHRENAVKSAQQVQLGNPDPLDQQDPLDREESKDKGVTPETGVNLDLLAQVGRQEEMVRTAFA